MASVHDASKYILEKSGALAGPGFSRSLARQGRFELPTF